MQAVNCAVDKWVEHNRMLMASKVKKKMVEMHLSTLILKTEGELVLSPDLIWRVYRFQYTESNPHWGWVWD